MKTGAVLRAVQIRLDAVPAPTASPAPDTVPMAALLEEAPMAAIIEAIPADEHIPVAAVVEAGPAVGAAPEPVAPAASAASGTAIPAGSSPKLAVIRGQKIGLEFPIYGDLNFIGRADEKPVDIDLEDQEPPDRVWCSRQHAVVHWDEAQGVLTIEDLNSANGTFVNRTRIHPGQKRQLYLGDVIQIGTVHLKVKV